MGENRYFYSHHVFLEDGQSKDVVLPEGVHLDGTTLSFDEGKYDLHVVIELHHDGALHYHFANNTTVNLVETRKLADNVKFTRTFKVDENANVNIFNENDSVNHEAIHFDDQGVVGSDSSFHLGYAELSDGSLDASYHFILAGPNANMKLRMAALSKLEEKKHYTVNIEHHAPYTYGIMDNYGVAKDAGNMIIDGIGTIKKGMHKSESHQTNKIMVFDEASRASANPYLYIDDYDVQASHAAGVGRMDENHLYYLQSRGLTKRQAMQLITYGYLKPVIDVVDNPMIKERFEKVLGKVGA